MSSGPTSAAGPHLGVGQIIPALKIFIEAILHRGELATLELCEARDHLLGTMMLGLVAIALALLGGFAATFTVAALVWDRSDRGLILGLVTLAYLLGGGLLAWRAARRLRSWLPLEETRRQLREDGSCIHELLTPHANSR